MSPTNDREAILLFKVFSFVHPKRLRVRVLEERESVWVVGRHMLLHVSQLEDVWKLMALIRGPMVVVHAKSLWAHILAAMSNPLN